MPTIIEADISLDFTLFEEHAGRTLQHETVRRAAHWAIDEAQRLSRPAIAYEWLPCRRGEGDLLVLGTAELRLGRHAGLTDQAQLACVAVCTIGAELEEVARRLMADGRNLDGYMLGEAGVFAVGTIIARVHRMVEDEASNRGWGVGAELAPGQLAGWALREQKALCTQVDIAGIGVRLTDSGMLVPQKSASILVGLGPGYTAGTVCSPCDFCDNRGTCSWRH